MIGTLYTIPSQMVWYSDWDGSCLMPFLALLANIKM